MDASLLGTLGLLVLGAALTWRQEWVGLASLPLVSWGSHRIGRRPRLHTVPEAVSASPVEVRPGPPPTPGLHLLLHELLPVWIRLTGRVDQSLREGSADLLASFSALYEDQQALHALLERLEAEDAARLQALCLRMGDECDRSLQGLQFLDRVTQMVDVLHLDQARLLQEHPRWDHAERAQIQAWLAELEATYTTEEQRHEHRGEAQSATKDSVNFF